MAASVITVLSLFFCLLQSASAGPQEQNVTADPGDDVTLSCQAPNNAIVTTVEWIRADLKKSVYLKIDGHPNTDDQDPSYVNRVQLEDDEMKNGNLSLILKNVTNNDEGRYVCLYVEERGGRRKRATQIKLISTVILNVKGPTDGDSESGKHREDGKDSGGEKDKHQHLGVFLPVTLIVSGLVGSVILKKLKGRSKNKSDLPVDDPDVL